MRCVALRYRTEDEIPAIYDQALLKLLYDGSASEVEAAMASAPKLANAQNVMGETVLMKARVWAVFQKAVFKKKARESESRRCREGGSGRTCRTRARWRPGCCVV